MKDKYFGYIVIPATTDIDALYIDEEDDDELAD